MPVLATDSFDGAGFSSDISAYSSDWTRLTGFCSLTTDVGGGYLTPATSGARSLHYWNSVSFDTDQYAQIALTAIAAGAFMGAAIRMTAGQVDTYGFYTDDDAQYLIRLDDGEATVLGSAGAASISADDVMYLEISGTTLTPKLNGSLHDPPGTQTDATYVSGAVGIVTYGNSLNTNGDDWEGGTLGAPAAENYLPGIAHRHIMTLRGS